MSQQLSERNRAAISIVGIFQPQSLHANIKTELRALGGFESPFGRSPTPVQNPYSDPALMESDADKSFSQTTLQQTAQKRYHSNDTAIAQREQEINDIAKGIIELADIFRELQGMVIDQGTMLDRIDYNVERMAVDVKGAEKELTVVSPSFILAIHECYCTTFLCTVKYRKSRLVLIVNIIGYGLSKTNTEEKADSLTDIIGSWNVHSIACQTEKTSRNTKSGSRLSTHMTENMRISAARLLRATHARYPSE